MTLNSEGLEKAYKAAEQIDGEWMTLRPNMVEAVVSAYLSALPPVDGLEVVAWVDAGTINLTWEKKIVATNPEYVQRNGGLGQFQPLVPLSQASSVIAGLRKEVAGKVNAAWLAGFEKGKKETTEADDALVDRYRDPKTGVFSFPSDVAAIVKRLDAAEARTSSLEEENKRLREALKQQIPGHRDPEGNCWCRYGHNPDYGHTLSCDTARQALEDHNG